jgi:hypothetical protein
MGEKGVWGVFFTPHPGGLQGCDPLRKKNGLFLTVFWVYFLQFFSTCFLSMVSNYGEGIRVV